MPDSIPSTDKSRKGRSLEDEIARQEAKLKKLQDNLKEKKRREYERNAKAISALLQTEHLDQVPVEAWQQHLPALKALFLASTPDAAPGDQKEKPAPAAPSPPIPAAKPQAADSHPAAASKPATNSNRT